MLVVLKKYALPVVLAFPWTVLLYFVAKSQLAKRARAQEQRVAEQIADAIARYEQAVNMGAPRPALAAAPPASTYAYMHHLDDCAEAAAMINVIRPAAINADVSSLLHAPDEAVHALALLSQPMDVLTAQRDLNVLGAKPEIQETGQLDASTREALRAFQAEMRQTESGMLDPATTIALRYSVGVVHYQNQMGAAQ